MDVFARYGLNTVINASGTMTALGASRVSEPVIQAMGEILPEFIRMAELQEKASEVICSATGAEAGVVTASCAGGISVAVAACMTGSDPAKVEQLPDTSGMRTEVILQKGHSCNFGSGVAQMVRISGAVPVEIGDVNRCGCYQLEGAINENTVAALYVISHHTVQSGLIELEEFCEICAKHDVSVIVDAASEYDLRGFLEAGASVVIYSGHKFLGGPTSGIIAGRRDLVQACYLQEKGIGRGFKVGKEGIIGVMEALRLWMERDGKEIWQREMARVNFAHEYLNKLDGVTAQFCPDPTGNPIVRLQVFVDQAQCGISAFALSRLLASHDPAIIVRDHHVDLGYFFLDPCNLRDGEMEIICKAIARLVSNPPDTVKQAGNLADLVVKSVLRWS